ncbi:winged helix-turn-helix domain-containing protein [Aquipluma nitroreducens]|nr:winged helix-turn-helix domain-containing protein [Aquipluma nitroreducens]
MKTVATTITATLEEEGIMSLEELKDLTNLEENDVLLAVDWLDGNERVELLPTGKVVSVMLVF